MVEPILEALAAGVAAEALARSHPLLRDAAVVADAADRLQAQVPAMPAGACARAETLVAAVELVAPRHLRARAALPLCVALAWTNAFERAVREADAAAADARAGGDPVLAARLDLAAMHALARQGRLDDAAARGQKALEELRTHGEPLLAVRAEANLAVIARMRGRPGEAATRFRAALQGWPPDPVGRAQLGSNLAEALMDEQRFEEAEAAFRDSLQALRGAAAPAAHAVVLGNLADLLVRQGRTREALSAFEAARRLHAEAGSPGDAARLRAEAAEALLQAGLRREAISELRGALRDLEDHGMREHAARTRRSLAGALLRSGAIAEAAALVETLDPAPAVQILAGQVAAAQGDHGGAEACFRQAAEASAERPAERALALAGAAQAAISAGRADVAEPLLAEAWSLASSLLIRPLQADILRTQGRMHAACGRRNAALLALRQAVATMDAARASLQAARFRMASAAETADARGELAAMLLEVPSPETAREAFAVMEAARARELLSSVDAPVVVDASGRTFPPDDAPAAPPEPARLRARLNALYSRLHLSPEAARSDAWRRDVLATEESLRVAEARDAAISAGSGPAAAPVDAETILRVLPAGQALLVFAAAGDRVLGFGLHDGRLEALDLASRAEVESLADRWRFDVLRLLAPAGRTPARAASIRGALERSGESLSELLLAPFTAVITGSTAVCIAGFGALHGVPAAALPLRGQPFGAQWSVTATPSASVLHRLLERRARRAAPPVAAPPLVVGVADDAAPAIEVEAREVASIHQGATLLLGRAATRDEVLRRAAGASLLHVACHGRFVAGDAGGAGLRLADGWLGIADIRSLKLPGTVVILSACETGRATVDAAEDPTGLVQAFLASGADAVVVSIWPVPDLAAHATMRTLHLALARPADGDASSAIGPASALRRAMVSLRDQGASVAEWAAFTIVGAPDARTPP